MNNQTSASKFKDEILQEISIRTKSFQEDKKIFDGYLNHSQSVALAYNGRQVFEMLQNMDDQMIGFSSDNCKSQIEFNKDEKVLIFKNTGKAFSTDGIKSIMYPDTSPKKATNAIGCKGLGFRSLLNWNPGCIKIKSAGLIFSFSKAIVSNIAKELKTDNLPILTFPDIDYCVGDSEWDTEIELSNLDDNACEKIDKELLEFNSELLLFLPHLCNIEITIIENSTNNTILYASTPWEKNDNLQDIVTRKISKIVNGELEFCTKWLAINFEIELNNIHLEDKSSCCKLSVAIPTERAKQHLFKKLYNYLPLEEAFVNLPCLIHATVRLNDTRNALLPNDYVNQKIFKELLPEVFEKFAIILRDNPMIANDPWLPFRLLTPEIDSDNPYIKTLYEQLHKIRQNGDFCHCVDKRYRKQEECFFYKKLPSCDPTNFFNENILIPQYVSSEVPDYFPEQEIPNEQWNNIATQTITLTDNNVAEFIYILWSIKAKCNNYFCIFQNETGDIIPQGTIIYTPKTSDESFEPPPYMNLDFIKESQWDAIKKRFEDEINNYPLENPHMRLRSFYNNELKEICGLTYYDKAELTKRMIKECNDKIQLQITIQEKRNYISQLLQALFKGYDSTSIVRKEKIPFLLDNDGKIYYTYELLLESAKKYYENKPLDIHFLTELDINEILTNICFSENKNIDNFLRYLGIRSDFRIGHMALEKTNEFFKELSRIPRNAGGLDTSGSLEKNINDVPYFLDKTIILNLPPEKIIEVICESNDLLNLLKSKLEISWKPSIQGQRNFIKYSVMSYLAYQLKGFLKYFAFEESDQTLVRMGKNISFFHNQIELLTPELLLVLGAKRKLEDFTPEDLYWFVNNIAEKNIIPTKEFYKKINSALTENEKRSGVTVSPNKNLRLYAINKNSGEKGFYNADEIYYHDNPNHASAILRNCKILFISSRIGADNVSRHFGVNKMNDSQVSIKKFESAEQTIIEEFNNDWQNKKIYFIALLRKHQEQRNQDYHSGERAINNINIQLVKNLTYSYQEHQEYSLDNFEYIRKDNIFYLNIGNVSFFSELNPRTIEFYPLCKSIAGILCDVIKLSDNDLEKQFSNCYYDTEITRLELEDDGDLINGELPLSINDEKYNREQKLRNNIELACHFLDKKIPFLFWDVLRNKKNEQKNFQNYINAYKTWRDGLKKENIGKLFKVLHENIEIELTEEKIKQIALNVFKNDYNDIQQTILPKLGDLNWDVDGSVPEATQYYSESLYEIGSDFEEIKSLFFFEGNQDIINEMISTQSNEQDNSTIYKEREKDYKLTEKEIIFTKPIPKNSEKQSHHGTGKAMTKRKYESQLASGDCAEKLVKKYLDDLASTGKISDVLLKSGRSTNVIGDDLAHYDISYKQNGIIFFVEVKFCTAGAFHMSASEYNFATRHKKNYRLALVSANGEITFVDDVINKIDQSKEPTDWLINFNFK